MGRASLVHHVCMCVCARARVCVLSYALMSIFRHVFLLKKTNQIEMVVSTNGTWAVERCRKPDEAVSV